MKPTRLHRFQVAALLACLAFLALEVREAASQQPVLLEEAVQGSQVEAVGQGKSISFSQPMVGLHLRNLSPASLTVVARPGLVLMSENPRYADVVVGSESRAVLQVGEERDVGLVAFSLDPARSFPPPQARYVVQGMSEAAPMLEVLGRIAEKKAERSLAAQLAVWLARQNLGFSDLEEVLGVSLTQFQTQTLELAGSTGPTATPMAGAGTTTEAPPATPIPGPGDGGMPVAILVAGGVASLALIIALGWAIVRRRPRAKDTAEAAPRAGKTAAGAENLCAFCGQPLSECACPGGRAGGRPGPAEGPAAGPGTETQLHGDQNRKPKSRDEVGGHNSGAQLVARTGQCVGSRWDVPGGVALLTRSRLPTLRLHQPGISSPHALLLLNRQPFQVRDLNSRAGTFHNGSRLPVLREGSDHDQDATLHDGDQITFGRVRYRFVESPPALQGEDGQIHRLQSGKRTIVSAAELPFIVVGDDTVSAPHAVVRYEEGRCSITDLNSGNSTEVGKTGAMGFDYARAFRPTSLTEGMRLRLGRVVLELRSGAQADTEGRAKSIGPYRVVASKGKGGMAEVFECQDEKGRSLAVKVPDRDLAYDLDFRLRFEREARSMKRLDHPNIVHILDVGEDTIGENLVGDMGLQYIAMDLVDGYPLDRVLKARPLLGERLVVELVRVVASALQHAHEQGVIHLDVKPSNVLISRQGRVFLTDFGIARASGEATITRQGEIPGSPQYMSPERAGNRPVDHRSDVYSLGVVLYQLLTGQVPFNGDCLGPTILVRHMNEPPLPPQQRRPDVPLYLATMAMKCLEKDPDRRYQSAKEILAGLPAEQAAASDLAALVAQAAEQRTGSHPR